MSKHTKQYADGGMADEEMEMPIRMKKPYLKDFESIYVLGGQKDEGETASGLPREARGRRSGRILNLPSDMASSDNKRRQDRDAIDVVKKIAKAAIMGPGAIAVDEMSSRGYAKGGQVSSASKRADGCAIKGKTRGRMI